MTVEEKIKLWEETKAMIRELEAQKKALDMDIKSALKGGPKVLSDGRTAQLIDRVRKIPDPIKIKAMGLYDSLYKESITDQILVK